jgi:hypothetical protein
MRSSIFSKRLFIIFLFTGILTAQTTYKIVDTGQRKYYNNTSEISAPSQGQSFYGQDANYNGNQPSYTNNGNGTITDNVTGLMWTKSYDRNGDGIINYSDKLYAEEAKDSASNCRTGGYKDWRLPTIKELYSLILFSGNDLNPMGTTTGGAKPFIDTTYFKIGWGDLSAGDRIIDAQVATSTYYGSTTMVKNTTMFGTNFVDGRIKGYPVDLSIGKKYYVLYVRNNSNYGKNNFVNNGNGTITDKATGLMWTKNDNGTGILWEAALSFAEKDTTAGYKDWRLPNAKELQSIVDYSRSPDITNSPAINPMFNCTQITNEAGKADYPCYWTGTTHCGQSSSDGTEACYVAFGRAMGYMSQYGGWIDVHGAGAQRSDPKTGDPSQYPNGHGPQGDAIRIYNYVRLVRNVDSGTGVKNDESSNSIPNHFRLDQNYPNPFNPETTISYSSPKSEHVTLKVFDVLGREIATLVNENKVAGNYNVKFNASELPSGIYIYRLIGNGFSQSKKMLLIK